MRLLVLVLGFAALAVSLSVHPVPLHAQDELNRCPAPFGTLAVVEPQDATLRALYGYELESPTGLIRALVQESGCFIVVERGEGMQNMMQERELAAAGQLAAGENVGRGQMQAADYILTPDVLFSEGNAGGVGGVVGGVIGGRVGAAIGAA